MGIVLATGYSHESKRLGEWSKSFMIDGRIGNPTGRPSEQAGLVIDPSFFPKS